MLHSFRIIRHLSESPECSFACGYEVCRPPPQSSLFLSHTWSLPHGIRLPPVPVLYGGFPHLLPFFEVFQVRYPHDPPLLRTDVDDLSNHRPDRGSPVSDQLQAFLPAHSETSAASSHSCPYVPDIPYWFLHKFPVFSLLSQGFLPPDRGYLTPHPVPDEDFLLPDFRLPTPPAFYPYPPVYHFLFSTQLPVFPDFQAQFPLLQNPSLRSLPPSYLL